MNGLHDMNVPYGRKLTWGFVLSTTYGLHREHFWPLFRIGLPIALLFYVFSPFQRMLVRQLLTFLARHGLVRFSPAYTVLLNVITFVTGAVYWSLNTLFFAATAGKLIIDEVDQGQTPSDAYSPVRSRLPALLIIALLTWTVFQLARLIVAAALATLLVRFNSFPINTWSIALITGLPVLLILGLVLRAALAIPELIDDPAVSPLRAIRNSIGKTENWEPFFIFFLIKTAIVGYGVYWAARRGFDFLWFHTSISASAYYWVTWAVYVCMFAMLESPLFIAFSVLYRESIARPEAALTAPAIG